MKLEALQDTIRDVIKKADLFKNDLVVSDLGLEQRNMEIALSGRGFCVAVSPMLSAGSQKDAQGYPANSNGEAALLNARIIATIRTNPTRNAAPANPAINDAGGASINIFMAISAVIHAVLSWSSPTNKTEKRFELDGEDAVLLATDDPGNLTYDIRFRKTVTT